MDKVIIQISAGKGPLECCRVVARVQEMLLRQARLANIDIEVLDSRGTGVSGALYSSTLLASGEWVSAFMKEWAGTVQWISPSPYRSMHKRKNWFIGVAVYRMQEALQWSDKEVLFESCRASGPGGQHVNKVETAVRGTHIPSGIQVLAMDSRSQLQNKKQCMERLKAKVMAWQAEKMHMQLQEQWMKHHTLERGNAVKTITASLR